MTILVGRGGAVDDETYIGARVRRRRARLQRSPSGVPRRPVAERRRSLAR